MRKLRQFSTLIIITTLMVAFQNCGETKFRKKVQSSAAAPEEIQTSSEAPITLLDQTVFEGQSVIFQAVLGQEAVNPSFVWSHDGEVLNSTSEGLFEINNAQLSDQGLYQVEYFDGDLLLGEATARATVIQQFFAPEITSHPQSQSVRSKTNVSFSVVATGKDLTYQWKKNGVVIAGQTQSTLDLVNLSSSNAGVYSVLVSNEQGEVESNEATLTVQLTTVSKSFSLGSNGCGSGYCSAAIGGHCGSTDSNKASAICRVKGYDRATSSSTMAGPRATQCGPSGSGCFWNQNPGCNRVFTSVVCQRQE